MSYERRRMELICCSCCDEKTVHCETKDGEMRCEICGR